MEDPGVKIGFSFNLPKGRGPSDWSRWRRKQMMAPAVMKALPFWQYITVGDDRVHPSHAVLDGFTALATDPVWEKIYPPNGRGCRCIVIAILASEAPDEAREDGMTRLKSAKYELAWRKVVCSRK